jgi:hypothetical protein
VAKAPRPTLTFVGRLRRYKGLDWVLRALPALRARVPDVRLEIIGDGPHGEALRRDVQRLGLSGVVEFLGFLPAAEKVARLQSSWAVLQPSPKEGWGLTVVEASACGTAVIASDAPGCAIRCGATRPDCSCPYGDDAALADAMTRVLTDAALRDRLARAGLEWAARFRWDECGPALDGRAQRGGGRVSGTSSPRTALLLAAKVAVSVVLFAVAVPPRGLGGDRSRRSGMRRRSGSSPPPGLLFASHLLASYQWGRLLRCGRHRAAVLEGGVVLPRGTLLQ